MPDATRGMLLSRTDNLFPAFASHFTPGSSSSRPRISNRQNWEIEFLQLIENTASITVLIAKDLRIRVFREPALGMKPRRGRGPNRVRCSVSQFAPSEKEPSR